MRIGQRLLSIVVTAMLGMGTASTALAHEGDGIPQAPILLYHLGSPFHQTVPKFAPAAAFMDLFTIKSRRPGFVYQMNDYGYGGYSEVFTNKKTGLRTVHLSVGGKQATYFGSPGREKLVKLVAPKRGK